MRSSSGRFSWIFALRPWTSMVIVLVLPVFDSGHGEGFMIAEDCHGSSFC